MSTNLRRLFAQEHKSITTISIFILGGFTSIFFNIYLSRTVGPSDYGNFKVAEAFFFLGGIIAVMGGASAAPRFLLYQIKDTKNNGSWHYVRFYSYLSFIVTIILGIFVFVGHWYNNSTFDGPNYHPMLFAIIIIPIFAISNLLSSVLQSAEKLELAFLPWGLGYALLSIIACFIYNAFIGSLNDISAFRITIFVTCCLTVFTIFFIYKFKLMPIKKAPAFLKPKTWLAISVPMMIAASLQYLMQKMDIFMIEYLIDEIAVGHYAAAQTVNNIFIDIQLAVIAIYSPKLAQSLTKSPARQVKTILSGFKLSLLVSVPFILVIVFYGFELLMIFRNDTPLAYNSLLILLLGYIPTTLTASAVVWLQYNGHAKGIMYLLLAAVIVNATLNWLLIPIIDIEGASIATSIAMIITVLGFCFWVQKELNIFGGKKLQPVST